MTSHTSPDETDRTREDAARRSADDRAVAEILGSILLFGLVVLLIALIQLNAVPAANQQVEFEHNQRVQGDMQELQEVVARTAGTGIEGSVKIEAGTGYPNRFFLFNPPRATGRLELGDEQQVSIRNLQATSQAGDHLNDTGSGLTFDTASLSYQPNYNEYRNAPTTVYENGLVYNRYGTEQAVVQSRGALVSGRRISLTALRGQLSTSSGGSVPLDVTSISGPSRTVSVSDDGDPIELQVPTRLSEAQWNDILSDEMGDGGYVEGPVTVSNGVATIELEQGVTYDLQLGAVGIGSGFDGSTDAEYIVDVDGIDANVPEGGTQPFTVEVRDEYNNPVSGVAVTTEVEASDGAVTPVSATTDSDGRAQFVYDASGVTAPTTVDVTAYFGAGSAAAATDEQQVTFEMNVIEFGGSTAPSYTFGGSNDAIAYASDATGDESSVRFTIANGFAEPMEITEIRVDPESGSNTINKLRNSSGREIDIDADLQDGYFDTASEVNNNNDGFVISLDQHARLSPGTDATVRFSEFRKANNEVAIVDEPLVVRVTYTRDGVSGPPEQKFFLITPG